MSGSLYTPLSGQLAAVWTSQTELLINVETESQLWEKSFDSCEDSAVHWYDIVLATWAFLTIIAVFLSLGTGWTTIYNIHLCPLPTSLDPLPWLNGCGTANHSQRKCWEQLENTGMFTKSQRHSRECAYSGHKPIVLQHKPCSGVLKHRQQACLLGFYQKSVCGSTVCTSWTDWWCASGSTWTTQTFFWKVWSIAHIDIKQWFHCETRTWF